MSNDERKAQFLVDVKAHELYPIALVVISQGVMLEGHTPEQVVELLVDKVFAHASDPVITQMEEDMGYFFDRIAISIIAASALTTPHEGEAN